GVYSVVVIEHSSIADDQRRHEQTPTVQVKGTMFQIQAIGQRHGAGLFLDGPNPGDGQGSAMKGSSQQTITYPGISCARGSLNLDGLKFCCASILKETFAARGIAGGGQIISVQEAVVQFIKAGPHLDIAIIGPADLLKVAGRFVE